MTTILPWDPTKDHYEGGDEVWDQGGLFQANYWTQANPLTDTSGSWTTLQPTINTPEAPWAPTGLHSTFTSSSIVNLSWDPAVVPGIGTVTQYDVFENGAKIGSTNSTSFHISGLTASTAYQFTVDAVDATDTGPQTAAYSVTTSAPTYSSGQYYSPYVDMSLAPPSNNLITTSENSGITSFTLAFLQNASAAGQVPVLGWGGSSAVPITNDGGITAAVQTLQGEGGTITIAFGGAAGTDPANAVDTYFNHPVSGTAAWTNAVAMLQGLYQSVMTQYGVSSLDFDIEGATAVNDVIADHLRDAAIVNLEAAHPDLKISFTLPTMTTGLDPNAGDFNGNVKALLTYAAQDHVRIDVLNIMAMDYFDGVSGSMALKAEAAATAVHQQLIDAGFSSTKVGITPMVGLNDDTTETFSIADAQTLEAWAALPAQQSWIAGFGIWSMARDHGVAPDPNNPSMPVHEAAPQPTDSGQLQTDYQYSSILNQITVGTAPPTTGQTFVGDSTNQTFAGTAAGNDTVDYFQHATAGVTVDLNKTTPQMPGGGMGTDTLTSIENLLGSGFGDHLYGNAGVNMLTGNAGDDFLDGRGGADIMTGGAGNDTYYVDNLGDQIVEGAGDTADKAYTKVDNYVLGANAQVEYLYVNVATGLTVTGNAYSHHIYGGAGVDHLNGGSGADSLNGEAGADVMAGGNGNDSYTVDNLGDIITEGTGGGMDKVYVNVDGYHLNADAQAEYLYVNSAAGLTVFGNDLYSHHIYGNSGADHLNGGANADILDGKGGADTMAGGGGNDSYYVDNASDTIVEGTNGGTDKVYVTTTSYTLNATAQVEYLYADDGNTGVSITGNNFAAHLTGANGADHLTGGTSNDILDGKAGADTMAGGLGNDTYYVDNVGDTIVEAGGGGSGLDKVYVAPSAGNYVLNADAQVEYLYANGGATGASVTGNAFSNHIYAGAGAGGDHLTGGSSSDVIVGGGGNDTINGGGGRDFLTGGNGNDTFVFGSVADSPAVSGQYDTIEDFSQGHDKIDLLSVDANANVAGDQAFHFVGSGAFVAAGDLRAVVNANGTTTVTGDTNGDHHADFEFTLATAVTLNTNDFLHL